MVGYWREKSRRDLFREIASNANGDDPLLTTGQAERMLFGDATAHSCSRYRLMRLVQIGDLPVAARSPGGRRRYRYSDVLALRERARKEAA